MKTYRLLGIVAILSVLFSAGAGLIRAQNDCGDGLPCGKIPWDLPVLPGVPSPTPMPTIAVTLVAPTQTPGGPTATPAPTNAGFDIDVSGINDQFATLQSVAAATPIGVEIEGTPFSAEDQINEMATGGYEFFGYVRAVSSLDLGGLTPFLTFLIVSLVTVISVKTITFIMPVLLMLFNFIRNIIGIVLDFLPL